MKRASKLWTRDERQRLILLLSDRIRTQAQKPIYGDAARLAIFQMADSQIQLATRTREFLEQNREQIEQDCGN